MKIKAKIKCYLNNYDVLHYKIVFKIPNKWFRVSIDECLEPQFGFDSMEEYYERCLNKLKDRDMIIELAKEAVVEYLNNKYKKSTRHILENKCEELMNDIEFEFDYNK